MPVKGAALFHIKRVNELYFFPRATCSGKITCPPEYEWFCKLVPSLTLNYANKPFSISDDFRRKFLCRHKFRVHVPLRKCRRRERSFPTTFRALKDSRCSPVCSGKPFASPSPSAVLICFQLVLCFRPARWRSKFQGRSSSSPCHRRN